ncbi:MAG: ABC transporter ATP-binding protein, partial [Actinobacteria bacterium]|nr:ABC transporter ATP-binding protein [Actinomycetota bacterium]
SLAHRVIVMYAGRLVEVGPSMPTFRQPAHPYTSRLIEAIPDLTTSMVLKSIPGKVPPPGERPEGCVFAERCEHASDACREPGLVPRQVRDQTTMCLRAEELEAELRPRIVEAVHGGDTETGESALLAVEGLAASYGSRQVLAGVDFQLHAGQCIALVGESGSGKTTLSRSIAGLHGEWSGEVKVDGTAVAATAAKRPKELCRRMQYVFQSPYNSLNPRRTVGETVRGPIQHFFGVRGGEAERRVTETLERVALPARAMHRYPTEMSGGERQRVAIARALAAEPEILICDEVTSALDTSVQAAIVALLQDLQERERLGILFVTHNIALVRTIAERVLVLDKGSVVEDGTTVEVLDRPQNPYTQSLIEDTPNLGHGGEQTSVAPAG